MTTLSAGGAHAITGGSAADEYISYSYSYSYAGRQVIGFAADLKEMVGTWRWRDFTLDVKQWHEDSVCAKVVGGPKNGGLDVFTSKLIAKGEDWFGEIADPGTKATYNTRFHQVDKDHWRLDGCTSANVCLGGEFVRAR